LKWFSIPLASNPNERTDDDAERDISLFRFLFKTNKDPSIEWRCLRMRMLAENKEQKE